MITCNFVPVAELKTGDTTVLGDVVNTELSRSGRTMLVTVQRADGSTFTDRISARGNMAVFR